MTILDANEALSGLPDRHVSALRWFLNHADSEQPWPQALANNTKLASKAKGIYKPEWTDYALSVRHSLGSPYQDRRPEILPDGSWVYMYFQENKDPTQRDLEYTNVALVRCMSDRVPIGVMVQMSRKPQIRYLILGLGLVESWDNGYFRIVGINKLPNQLLAQQR